MLELRPCLDMRVVSGYCKKCGKPPSPAFYLYLAKAGDELLAAGLFEVSGDGVCVAYYESADAGDHHIFDAVLRAGLNYAAGQGIVNGYLPEGFREAHAAVFSKLNYPAQAVFDISNFFNKYKSCI